jgi:hypothetical protein
MKRFIYYMLSGVAIAGLLFGSCEKQLEPEVSNIYTKDVVLNTVNIAEGILLTAYLGLPVNHSNFNLDYASDDAVTNNRDASVKTANSGGWTSDANPFGVWNSAYENIFYINSFFQEIDKVVWWWKQQDVNDWFAERLRGEAFGLRAHYYFTLLQAHAGKGTNGEMLGVPIVDHVLDPGNPADYQIPRSTFNELVEFILTDCDSAIALLPNRYENTKDIYYNIAGGEDYTNRINGMAARMIKAKTLLYAASPSYSDGTYSYQRAAEAAAEIMDLNGGLDEIVPENFNHLQFYSNGKVTGDKNSHPEVFWYSSSRNINSWEDDNYPPTWYGLGRTNPTQELVNAFPMATGIPVRDNKINSSDPYSGRDKRLSLYIFYNGMTLIRGGDTLTIDVTEGSQDAPGSSDPNTTLTGYYLKKFMNLNVNVNPAVNSNGPHYYVYARYTDALLMFAEAANEAVGPDGDIGGYTARTVINAIRKRAGISSTFWVGLQDQVGLAELIKIERRLEMCFENQRFWDLRRWGMTDVMAQPVTGVKISADDLTPTYVTVESRNYQAYQIYGPIPYGETLKYDMIQNEGW